MKSFSPMYVRSLLLVWVKQIVSNFTNNNALSLPLQMTDLLFCVYLLCVVAQHITYVKLFWLTTIVIIVSVSGFIFSPFINFTSVGENGLELRKINQVRITRSYKRRAKARGADAAVSDVLAFLNSRIAWDEQLLQPFLKGVQKNPIWVVCLIFDAISMDMFHYIDASANLHMTISEPSGKSDTSTPPTTASTPMITSGLFYVDKTYFTKSEKFDVVMDVWGVENPEILFRVWQCDGSLEIIPCSHAGHVFSRRHRYSFPGGRRYVFARSTRLSAEVWIKEYKKYYYSAVPLAENISFDKEFISGFTNAAILSCGMIKVK
uniref:Uncharacterized protein n=1 Tax=Glossina pallidipes TaxID=7398 RepID=A0A1A9Z4E0_GLOPL